MLEATTRVCSSKWKMVVKGYFENDFIEAALRKASFKSTFLSVYHENDILQTLRIEWLV